MNTTILRFVLPPADEREPGAEVHPEANDRITNTLGHELLRFIADEPPPGAVMCVIIIVVLLFRSFIVQHYTHRPAANAI